MLFIPWRQEEQDLLADFETYAEAYATRQNEITTAKSRLIHHSDMVADAIDNLIDSGPPVSAWDALASEQRQCEDEGTVPETFVSCGDEELLNTTFVDVPADAQSQPTDNNPFCYRRFEIVTGRHLLRHDAVIE